MNTYRLTKDIPVDDGYDVLVAGGGIAGVSAAICAARLKARVVLLEATGCLGGLATSGLVTSFDPMADGHKMLVGGLMKEVVELMYARRFIPDYVSPDQWRKNLYCWTPFDPEGLKLILDELACECGVEVRLFTKVIDVEKDPDRLCVRGAVVHNVEGYRHIRAKAFIDATGDAVLSDLCGVGCREPGKDTPKAMGATLCSLFGGISWDSIGMGGVNGAINPADEEDALARALADDHFTQCDHHLPGMHRIGKSTGHLNGGHIFDLDPLNCASLTAGMISGRKIVREYESFYRKYVRGFQDSELVVTASSMGVRESRRISGEYELRYDDYCARRQFSDQIGVYNKFVDIHPYDLSAKELMRYRDEIQSRATWLREGECYGIPYGILVPRNSVNLWVAGRCNSSDIKVHGAIRVQPACSMMGQAAGTAAVQSVSSHQTASGLDTAELVLALRRADAYLPQANLSKTMSRTSAV